MYFLFLIILYSFNLILKLIFTSLQSFHLIINFQFSFIYIYLLSSHFLLLKIILFQPYPLLSLCFIALRVLNFFLVIIIMVKSSIVIIVIAITIIINITTTINLFKIFKRVKTIDKIIIIMFIIKAIFISLQNLFNKDYHHLFNESLVITDSLKKVVIIINHFKIKVNLIK